MLSKLRERLFRILLRLTRRVMPETGPSPTVLARAGIAALPEDERIGFLAKWQADLVGAEPRENRPRALWEMMEPALKKLDASQRRRLPAKLLRWVGKQTRPSLYARYIASTAESALQDLDGEELLHGCGRLIQLAATPMAVKEDEDAALFADDGVPLIVGPWTTEVGFELLYWIPLLRYYLERFKVSPDRIVAVSRGGVGAWYDGVASRYVELFDFLSPDEFRMFGERLEAERRSKKAFAASDAENEFIAELARRSGLTTYRIVHPSVVYRLFRVGWTYRFGGDRFLPWLRFAPIPNSGPRPAGLPFEGDYVATKFYSSPYFAGDGVGPFLETLLGTLAKDTNVVVLNTGLNVDDHKDLSGAVGGRVFDATKLSQPANNLAVQSALVAGARKLYCSYGGFSYLGPLLGVDTVSFFTSADFVSSHMDLAMRVFNRAGYGALGFVPVRAADAETGRILV